MSNSLIDENFQHIRMLAKELDGAFGSSSASEQLMRNEIAGMFAVTVAATYEGLIKQTLIDYAGRFHSKYRSHVEENFSQSNARISIDDLIKHSRQFGLKEWSGPGVKKNSTTFHRILSEMRPVVERRFRADLMVSYKNIFTWRNAYAHERETSATLGDVYKSHRVAQYVIRSFVKAFELG